MHIIFLRGRLGGSPSAGAGGGGYVGGGGGGGGSPRDRTSFARDKLSTFFYYYCSSMEFIPARVGNRIADTVVRLERRF